MFLFEMGLSDKLDGLLQSMLTAFPKILTACIVLLLGFLLAKIVRSMILVALKKINIDKIGEKLNSIDIVDKSNIKIEISKVLSTIVYYVVILFVLIIATSILDLEPVSNLVVGIFEFVPKLLVALIILVLGTLFADALKSVVYTACNSVGIPSAKLISNFIFYFLLINILVSALSQAEINTDFLSTNISILIAGLVLAFAIGYGLSSRDTMSNYLSSFYSKDRFNIGDRVTLEDTTGLIIDIDKTSLTIDTGSSKVIMPLSKVSNGKIEIHN